MDGSPKGDEVGIKLWADLLKSHMERKYFSHIKHGTAYVKKSSKYMEDH